MTQYIKSYYNKIKMQPQDTEFNTKAKDFQTNSQIQNNFEQGDVSNQSKQKLRVLFLGDQGVGKTSIIITLISDQFPKHVQKTYHAVTLSPD